jgi:hypothetical protein
MNHDAGRSVCISERVMLLAHAVRRQIGSHLHRVEIRDRVELRPRPTQQHGLQSRNLR